MPKLSTNFQSILLPHLSSAVPSEGEGSRRGRRQFVFDEENYAGRDLDVAVMNNRIGGRRGSRRTGAHAAGQDNRRARNTSTEEDEEEEVLDVAVNNRAGRNLDIDVSCNEFVSDGVHGIGGVRMGARNRAGRDNKIRIAQNSLD